MVARGRTLERQMLRKGIDDGQKLGDPTHEDDTTTKSCNLSAQEGRMRYIARAHHNQIMLTRPLLPSLQLFAINPAVQGADVKELDLEAIDRTCKPCDDFCQYAIGARGMRRIQSQRANPK